MRSHKEDCRRTLLIDGTVRRLNHPQVIPHRPDAGIWPRRSDDRFATPSRQAQHFLSGPEILPKAWLSSKHSQLPVRPSRKRWTDCCPRTIKTCPTASAKSTIPFKTNVEQEAVKCAQSTHRMHLAKGASQTNSMPTLERGDEALQSRPHLKIPIMLRKCRERTMDAHDPVVTTRARTRAIWRDKGLAESLPLRSAKGHTSSASTDSVAGARRRYSQHRRRPRLPYQVTFKPTCEKHHKSMGRKLVKRHWIRRARTRSAPVSRQSQTDWSKWLHEQYLEAIAGAARTSIGKRPRYTIRQVAGEAKAAETWLPLGLPAPSHRNLRRYRILPRRSWWRATVETCTACRS